MLIEDEALFDDFARRCHDVAPAAIGDDQPLMARALLRAAVSGKDMTSRSVDVADAVDMLNYVTLLYAYRNATDVPDALGDALGHLGIDRMAAQCMSLIRKSGPSAPRKTGGDADGGAR